MKDKRPICFTCNKNDQVFEEDVKTGKTKDNPRHWRCLRCDTRIRKVRL